MRYLSRRIDKVAEREERAKQRELKNHKLAKKKNKIKRLVRDQRQYKVPNSLGELFPQLVYSWSNNNTKSPYEYNSFSHSIVKWICPKCGDEFEKEIGQMTRRKHIHCSNCVREREVTDENNFELLFPDLAAEFNSEKNKIEPSTISYGKSNKYWFVCSECKYEWSARLTDRTIQGKGCPRCSKINSKGVKIIFKYLEDNNIAFVKEKKFDDCLDVSHLRFDFYLPKFHLLIEYQGKQHYEVIESWGGESGLLDRQKKDEIKRRYCLKNNIPLLEIPYWENKNIIKILDDILNK